MFIFKLHNLVNLFFVIASLTDILSASSDTLDIKNFERWKTDPSLLEVAFEKLEILKNTPDFLEEEGNRQIVGSAFSGLLYHYEVLDLDPEEKENLATNIREFESLISLHMRAGKINHSHLWLERMPQLEVVLVTTENIDALISSRKINEEEFERSSEKEVIKNGGSALCNITGCIVSPRFFRLPSIFEGNRFLIGGERIALGDSPDCYILNFVSTTYPDILGYAENLSSLVAIPNSKFLSIEFDFLDNRILCNEEVLKEYHIVLAPGGTFIFKTNHNSMEYYKNEDIKKELRKGVANIRKIFNIKTFQAKSNKDPSWRTEHQAYYYLFQATK